MLRSKAANNKNLVSTELDPNFPDLFDIKHDSCLHILNTFHATFEGFAVDIVSSLIRYCVESGFFSLEALNNTMLTFLYSMPDKSNKLHKELIIKFN